MTIEAHFRQYVAKCHAELVPIGLPPGEFPNSAPLRILRRAYFAGFGTCAADLWQMKNTNPKPAKAVAAITMQLRTRSGEMDNFHADCLFKIT